MNDIPYYIRQPVPLADYRIYMKKPPPIAREVMNMATADMSIENAFIKLKFNSEGYIESYYDKETGKTRKLQMEVEVEVPF